MKDLHPVQMKILRELLFHPNSRFSDLNIDDLTNDHFTYHINKLVKIGLVEKENDRYSLSLKGKEFAGRINIENAKVTKQAKVGVLYCCRNDEHGVTKYLMHKRLKEPFYGFLGFGTGKVNIQESISETAKRELLEETGLKGIPKFIGILHKTNITRDGQLLDDRVLFSFLFENPSGELIEKTLEGENYWMTKEEILNEKRKFEDLDGFIERLDSKEIFFIERTIITDEF